MSLSYSSITTSRCRSDDTRGVCRSSGSRGTSSSYDTSRRDTGVHGPLYQVRPDPESLVQVVHDPLRPGQTSEMSWMDRWTQGKEDRTGSDSPS